MQITDGLITVSGGGREGIGFPIISFRMTNKQFVMRVTFVHNCTQQE